MNSVTQKITSIAFVLLFFLSWELACIVFKVSDLVLPRPTAILGALYTMGPAIWPHALATFSTTVVGFMRGRRRGRPARRCHWLFKIDLRRALPDVGGLLVNPEGGAGPDPGPVVRFRRLAGDHHGDVDEFFSRWW